MSIDQIPIYLKISNILKEEILNGVYQVGELLPTENELEKKYVTSRTTIRNALGLLEREGLVVRRQGKGTVVMETKTIENMNYITSFAETLKEKNIKIETGSLNVELINPPQKVASLLNLKKGEKIYHVQRLRIADGIQRRRSGRNGEVAYHQWQVDENVIRLLVRGQCPQHVPDIDRLDERTRNGKRDDEHPKEQHNRKPGVKHAFHKYITFVQHGVPFQST